MKSFSKILENEMLKGERLQKIKESVGQGDISWEDINPGIYDNDQEKFFDYIMEVIPDNIKLPILQEYAPQGEYALSEAFSALGIDEDSVDDDTYEMMEEDLRDQSLTEFEKKYPEFKGLSTNIEALTAMAGSCEREDLGWMYEELEKKLTPDMHKRVSINILKQDVIDYNDIKSLAEFKEYLEEDYGEVDETLYRFAEANQKELFN